MSEISLDHNQVESLLRKYIRKGISLYLWGTTGIGKSQTVSKVASIEAKESNRQFVIWHKLSKSEKNDIMSNPKPYYLLIDKRLSQMDPSDLRGIPSLNGHETVEWKPPMWLKTISHPDAKGILFLDEINLSPPSLQASAYQIINDHALDELSISPKVSIIAAGNRKSDRANVYEIPKPLQNRFGHCILKVPHIDDWINWALDNDIDSRIISFLKFKSSHLFKFVPDSKEHSFPTPRSWGEFCSKLIKGLPDKTESDREIIKQLTSSSVGSGVAIEFVSFLKLKESIDFASILKDPTKVKDITQLDLKYSLLTLVSEWYDKNFKKNDLNTVLEIADNIEDEFAIIMLRMAKEKHKTAFQNQIVTLKLWEKLGTTYGKYII
jgi:hypothetical protein